MVLLKFFENDFKALVDNVDNWQERSDFEARVRLHDKATRAYKINCTGDVCRGDQILFVKQIWEKRVINQFGRMANCIYSYQLVEALVDKESYGEKTGQHTFTLILPNKERKLIKGRNLYAVGVWRKQWKDEEKRQLVLDEKHDRGYMVRKQKRNRYDY